MKGGLVFSRLKNIQLLRNMTVLVFKTNVQNLNQLKLIENKLNVALGFRKWDFDLNVPDKIFRVEVLSTTPLEIINLFKRLGIYCRELK